MYLAVNGNVATSGATEALVTTNYRPFRAGIRVDRLVILIDYMSLTVPYQIYHERLL